MRYQAKAIGSGAEVAQAQLLESYKSEMSLGDALKLAVRVLKEVMEDQMTSVNAQIASVTPSQGFRIHSEAELAQIISTI